MVKKNQLRQFGSKKSMMVYTAHVVWICRSGVQYSWRSRRTNRLCQELTPVTAASPEAGSAPIGQKIVRI